ncbi:MAG: VWA domain-containing protein [Akkermansiaceae bacterium]|nr:VWA domain-containing protein [Akkermansiaceae bacterium]
MSFDQPAWLILLMLIPFLGFSALMMIRLRRAQWSSFVAPRLRNVLLKRGSSLPRWLSLIFLLIACITLIIALARPRGDAGTKTEKTMGRNVMIALDISRSMKVSDVSPDRLTQAKVLSYELLESMPSERIGFIAFAGTPFVYAPLTIDHTAVRETIEQIDENWAPLGGSDLSAAVHLATETLKKTGQKNNALIILSDGEEISEAQDINLDEAIKEAERAGVYIVTVGFGTENGGYVPNPNFQNGQGLDENGRPVISRIQTAALRKIAEGTKGRFAAAGSGLDIPELVKSVVNDLDTFEMQGRERKISVEFYQWLVLPAILLLMVSIVTGTRWKPIQALALITGFFLTIDHSEANDITEAKNALVGKRYEEAQKNYHDLAEKSRPGEIRSRYRLGEASAAYKAQDFRAARMAFSESLLSQDSKVLANGHLGLGNSLFQLGWKGLNNESYPTDPAEIPDINRFDTIVKEAIAKLREQKDNGDSANPFEPLITNWSDSVRHYQSALALDPNDKVALKNRDLSMTYLNRLRELLKEEEEEMKNAMGMAQPGEGPPQEGEGDGKGKGKGKNKKDGKGDQEEGDEGENGPEKGEGDGEDEEENDQNGNNGPPKKDENQKGKNSGDNPNESPQERANRILTENADQEKGPVTPGQRRYRDAE